MVKLYQFLKTYGITISFAIAAVLCVISLLTITVGLGDVPMTNKDMYNSSAFNFSLYISYFLFIVSLIIAIIFPAVYFIQNIKDSKKILFLLPILVGVFAVCYGLASPEIAPGLLKAANNMGIDGGTMKIIETLLYVAYFLFVVSILAIIFATIRPLFLKSKRG